MDKRKNLSKRKTKKDIYKENIVALQERLRVSKEIHDGISQSLATISLSLQHSIINFDKNTENIKNILEKDLELLKFSSEQLVYSIYEPLSLMKSGLLNFIDEYAEKFNKENNINLTINIEGQEKIYSPHKELILWRIIKESLENIKKHSNAKDVNIEINFTGKYKYILIKDNGIGFDVSEIKEKNKNGIFSLAEKGKILGIKLKINSEKDKGCNVLIKI